MTAILSEGATATEAIPRAYNFAADLFQRLRDRGWLERDAYIDPRGATSYRQLTQCARKFASVLM